MSQDGIQAVNAFSKSPSSGVTLRDTRDIMPMTKLLAERLGVSEQLAFTFLRKFLGKSNAGTLVELKQYLSNQLSPQKAQEISKELKTNFQNTQNQSKPRSDAELAKAFKPLFKDFSENAVQARINMNKQAPVDKFSPNTAINKNINYADVTSSQRNFASWLVNNKAAFLILKSNPELANLLIASKNPAMNMSPAYYSALTGLIANMIKLKQGKSVSESKDEKDIEDINQEELLAKSDHESELVNSIKQTVEDTPVKAVTDFLLEAERFAEEEIANLWSLTLKKEKELEKKLMSELKKFGKK